MFEVNLSKPVNKQSVGELRNSLKQLSKQNPDSSLQKLPLNKRVAKFKTLYYQTGIFNFMRQAVVAERAVELLKQQESVAGQEANNNFSV